MTEPVAVPEPADRVAEPAPTPAPRTQGTIWDQLGGVSGMLDSGLPVVVFVAANALWGLTPGVIAALAAGCLIFGWRLLRRRPVTQAIGGLFGVGIAAYIAHRSGSAGGFFVLGIYTALIYGGLLLLSVLVRWPAVGLIWEGINGRGTAWRANRALVRRYDLATLVWVAMFASRYLVQNALLGREEIGWLAFAKIVMGYPLYVMTIVASVWIVMRGTGHKLPSVRSILQHRPGRSE